MHRKGIRYFELMLVVLLVLCIMPVGKVFAAEATVSWTAPVDNKGTASEGPVVEYYLMSSNMPITQDMWDAYIDGSTELMARIPTQAPKAPGTIENYIIAEPNVDIILYYTVVSKDIAGNYSFISNVVVRDFFRPSPVVDLSVK